MNQPEGREREARVKEQPSDVGPAWGRAIWLPTAAAVAAVVASIAYAGQFSRSKFFAVLATALVVVSASAVTGAVIGFLFGIPRARRAGTEGTPTRTASGDTTTVTSPEAEGKPATRPNSNLDDISDWLTKILVGVGLTQLGAIGGALGDLSRALGPSLGGAESSPVFGLALVITFTSTGFLIGYLWTRYYMPALLERAETDVQRELARRVERLQQKVERDMEALARTTGEVKAASEPREPTPAEAIPEESIIERVREHAVEFDQVYDSMESGLTRTVEMSRIVAHVQGLAQYYEPDPTATRESEPTAIRELFNSGRGGRVVALAWLAVRPNPDLFDLVLSGIQASRTAFEQYQALKAAESLASRLDRRDQERLRAVIEDQMKPGKNKYITRDSDRWPLAVHVLQLLS